MKIRRFFAKDMRSALSQVTTELGADAAILSTTKVTGGVEVVAATDYDEALLQARNKSSQDTPHSQPVPEQVLNEKDTNALSRALEGFLERQRLNAVPQKAPVQPKRSERDHSVTETNDYFTPPSIALAQKSPEKDVESSKFPRIEWSQEPTLVAMREELNLLRNLLQEQVSQLAWDRKCQHSPMGVTLLKELKQLGLTSEVSESLVGMCDVENDYEAAWQKSLALLSKKIIVGDDEILSRGGVVALVGPTGVGKTTTLAKLAAQHVLKYGANSVALITTDSYRIAAHDQIKTFGRILQIPVRIVNDEMALKEALFQYSDKRLVLVDTAGMSQRDERMTQQMHCLVNERIKIRNYLVLSATSQTRVLHDAIRLFSPFHISGCVITKLDEAASLGEIISTILEYKLRVTYTTDGQRVPEDIRVARAHHLVSKMVWLTHQKSKQNEHQQATGTH